MVENDVDDDVDDDIDDVGRQSYIGNNIYKNIDLYIDIQMAYVGVPGGVQQCILF